MQLLVSVARYHPESPLWEVLVWWDGDKPEDEIAATFGSEKKAREFADKLRGEVTRTVARAFLGTNA